MYHSTIIIMLSNSIHDRKMSVLGLCSLLQCPARPPVIHSNATFIVPLIIQQLDLLVAAYRSECMNIKCVRDCVLVC